MGEKALIKKKSNKLMLAIICIAVILVATVAGIYYYASPKPTADKPVLVTNLSDGAWVNYTAKYYENSNLVSQGTLMEYVIAGTYNGADCWIYVGNETYPIESGVCSKVYTYYLSKTTNVTQYETMQEYTNGELTDNQTYSTPAEGLFDIRSSFENTTLVAKDQSITVPAGTFSVTQQKGPSIFAGTSYDITVYINKDVPGWGVVEYQYYLANGALESEYLLQSYGS
jgi:hypothetical protein